MTCRPTTPAWTIIVHREDGYGGTFFRVRRDGPPEVLPVSSWTMEGTRIVGVSEYGLADDETIVAIAQLQSSGSYARTAALILLGGGREATVKYISIDELPGGPSCDWSSC